MSIMLTHGITRTLSGPSTVPPAEGPLEWLRSIATPPVGITFDPDTGMMVGTAVNSTEPTWASTDSSLTDSGVGTTNMSNLQSKINTIASTLSQNTLIIVPLGTHTGTLTLPANTTSFWIGLRCPNAGSVLPTPSPGTFDGTVVPSITSRVDPTDLASLPQFIANAGEQPQIVTTTDTARYFIRGLAFTNDAHYYNSGGLIFVGVNVNTTPAHHISISQCYFDGGAISTATTKLKRCVMVPHGYAVSVTDCYSERIGIDGLDSQFFCVLGSAGGGGFKMVNNHSKLCGPSYHFISGGTALPGDLASNIPTDIEIRWNTLDYPASYIALTAGLGKNVVETKYSKRMLVEANHIPLYPGLSEQLYALASKLSDSNSGANGNGYNSRTEDTCFRFNLIENGKSMFSLSGIEYSDNLTVPPDRIECSHNLMLQRYAANVRGGILSGCNRMRVNNNTIISGGDGIFFNGGLTTSEVNVDYNVIAWVNGEGFGSGISKDSENGSTAVLAVLGAGSTVRGNVLSMASTGGYTDNFLPGVNPSSINFTDYSALDLTLGPTSAGYQAMPNGEDCGVYFPVLNALLAGIV